MTQPASIARPTLPAKCSHCDRPLQAGIFCEHCRTLAATDSIDHFRLLGLEPRYDLDPAELRSRYFHLARLLHPDRLAGRGAELAEAGLRAAAQLNRAHKVLGDPVLRAEYLLELHGGRSAREDKNVPEEVLMETLTLREEIAEARAADDRAALSGLAEQVRAGYEHTLAQVQNLARRLPGDAEARDELRRRLNSIKYYQKMLEQLR
jgi:molecular chaperone HscB